MYLKKLLSLAENDTIAIIGIGQENLQFIDWLINTAKVPISKILLADQKNIDLSSEILTPFQSHQDNIFTGDNYLEVLNNDKIKLAFKAPGIWSLQPEFENFRSIKGHDSIHSSLVFFYEKYRNQIISVTGTKGKSTTSSLLNHLLNASDSVTSHYCGNTTNISPYQFWKEINQKVNTSEYFVIETSSFQLQDLGYAQVSGGHGVITNYYVDHQDQHGKPEEYWKAKDNIFKYQKDGEMTLITESVATNTQTKNKLDQTLILHPEFSHKIATNFDSTLHGVHNESNIGQAILTYLKITNPNIDLKDNEQVLKLVLLNTKQLQKAFDTYKPLSHRQEIIHAFTTPLNIKTRKLEQTLTLTVRFVDDGAATEPDAVIAAIKTLTSKPNQYIWLYITGKDKGGSLAKLSKTILDTQLTNQLYKINYCGEVGQKLLSQIYSNMGIDHQSDIETFKQTVTNQLVNKEKIIKDFHDWISDQIAQLEELGDNETIKQILSTNIELNITLSPCGSSFDEFSSYQERCLWFQKQVQSIL
jgi:UDP-N-acetylmuramoylalanine-D-glutamate ligase